MIPEVLTRDKWYASGILRASRKALSNDGVEIAVPMSGSAISAFRHHMIERWHRALMRRSQRRRLTRTRMKTIADRYLPFPRILRPWPEKWFLVTIQGGSPVR
jgi:hypothetical protein